MKSGKAGLTIVSTAFVGLGKMQSKALGMGQLPLVVIDHPFGVRSREDVRGIAAHCAQEIDKLAQEGSKA